MIRFFRRIKILLTGKCKHKSRVTFASPPSNKATWEECFDCRAVWRNRKLIDKGALR